MIKLTNTDKRQIEADTDALMSKIRVASTEYARAYEIAFFEALIGKIQWVIEAKQYVADYIKKKEA